MEGKQFRVQIERFDHKGVTEGVVPWTTKKGYETKIHLIVPFSLPGEEMDVTVEHAVRRKWMTKVDRVISTHEDRIEPACPHFTKCGGCSWQHISYEGQLKEKTSQVKRYVAEQGFDDSLVQSIIGMEEPWTYRNKMEFTFGPDGSLGLHEKGNYKKVIPLETCLIMKPQMKEAVLAIADWVKEFELPGYDKETAEGLL